MSRTGTSELRAKFVAQMLIRSCVIVDRIVVRVHASEEFVAVINLIVLLGISPKMQRYCRF